MKTFDNGIRYYTMGHAEIGFPEEDIICQWCPLLERDYQLDRCQCRLTGEYIPYPKAMIGYRCPITFNNIEKEEDN